MSRDEIYRTWLKLTAFYYVISIMLSEAVMLMIPGMEKFDWGHYVVHLMPCAGIAFIHTYIIYRP